MRKRHRSLQRELAAFAPLNPRFDPRNILSRSAQTLRGRLCSKAGADLRVESKLQATFCLRTGAHPAVAWFTTEPFAIAEILQPYDFQYTPDGAVRYWDGSWDLVETKYFETLQVPEVWTRIVRIRGQIERFGFGLRVSTDRELYNERENASIRNIKSHIRRCDWRGTDRLVAQLNGNRYGGRVPITVSQADQVLGGRSATYHLIAQRRLYVDYTLPITADSMLYFAPEEVPNAIALFSDW